MSVSIRRVGVLPFFNTNTVTCLIVFLFASIILSFRVEEDKSGVSSLYLLMLIQATPFILCFARNHYDYLAFVMFNHLVSYSVAKYNAVKILGKMAAFSPSALLEIQQMTICAVLIICFYYFFRHLFFYRHVQKEKFLPLYLSRGEMIIAAVYVIAMPLYYRYLPSGIIIFHFTLLSLDLALLLSSTSLGNERLASLLRLMIFLSGFYYFIKDGTLSVLGNLAGILFITSCIKKNYKALIIPFFVILLGCVIQPVKGDYRMGVLNHKEFTMLDRFTFLGELIYIKYFVDPDPVANNSIASDDDEKNKSEIVLEGFARVGDESLERVMKMTPSQVPFWNGETYASIPFVMIPRFLWPDKPNRHIWHKFGKQYGYLGDDDDATSVAVSFLAEGYMNFGFLGLYLSAIVFAFVVSLAERIGYWVSGGYYFFTFIIFLVPVLIYANDMTSIVLSIFNVTVVVLVFRKRLLKFALRDDYS